MTYQPDETAEIPDAVIETKLVEDVAPSVLAKRKLEEEQKKRVEEEQRIQQMIEEAKLADPDAPIELVREVVFQQL
jgi:hypothetical protein